jgi:hypothetical protein
VAATVSRCAGLLARGKARSQSILVWTVNARLVWAVLVAQDLTDMLDVLVVLELLAAALADIHAATSALSRVASDLEVLSDRLLSKLKILLGLRIINQEIRRGGIRSS